MQDPFTLEIDESRSNRSTTPPSPKQTIQPAMAELELVQVLLSFYEGTAQPYQWGILAGCCVYTATVLVVLYLLVAGGSFQRMREQVCARGAVCVKGCFYSQARG